jgi:hypothetical protein
MNSPYGAIAITLSLILFMLAYLIYSKSTNKQKNIGISQSMLQYRYSNITKNSRRINVKSQSKNHHDSINLKVIIFDNQAYWIKDNIFYKAPMVNEQIDKDLVEQVDTISMDRVQLDKMLFIMDKLREGINNDSRGSRDEQF